MILNLECSCEITQDLLACGFGLSSSGWGLSFCISNKLRVLPVLLFPGPGFE